MPLNHSFASDNNAGIHPVVLQAIGNANEGHCIGYGDDPFTAAAYQEFRKQFDEDVQVFFVFNGTGANVLALRSVVQSYHSVICAKHSHLNVDECGAPENFTGCKIETLPSTDGKIRPEQIEVLLEYQGIEHHAQPRVISITQSTELGTVYRVEEIKALADLAHRNGLLLHMDGARLSNAAAFLECSLRAVSSDAGVDILSFGGTKNGLMLGEAVIFFRPELAEGFKYIRKQGMHLGSKMRFISAQFTALLRDELWLQNARHANRMARYLAQRLKGERGVKIVQEVEANAVFAKIPGDIVDELRQRFFFYLWDSRETVARFMTAFDTTEEDVDGFATFIRELIADLPDPLP
jgi:threonine aldolase